MAPQINEHIHATTTKDSLIDYLNGGKSPTIRAIKRSRRRACPVISLLGLLAHLVISGLGVAISVLAIYYHLQVASAGSVDLVARITLLAASCMGLLYALMHVCAAREHYIRSHATPQTYGYFTVAVAVLIMRLGLPVWAVSAVLTAVVARENGFHAAEGITSNALWVQLVIACLGL